MGWLFISSNSSANSPLPVILTYDDSERKTAEEVVHRMVKRAVDMEGTVTVGSHMATHSLFSRYLNGR